MTEGVRGRKRKYCSDECKDRFNLASREADKASKASSRKWKKQTARKEIIDWLCNLDNSPYSRKDAEKIYEEEKKAHPTNVASLNSFQNTWFKGYY